MSYPRKLISYLDDSLPTEDTVEAYAASPGSTFLAEMVHVADAINLCKRRFEKRRDGQYNRDGRDSLYRLTGAALAGIMGHFETFQRNFFAGCFEATCFATSFKFDVYFKDLKKNHAVEVDYGALASYRGMGATAGKVVADSFNGWHDPDRVNTYLRGLAGGKINFFSKDDARDLTLLWQLRHSVVHTAGWITHHDAQKTPGLGAFADSPVRLQPNFTDAVVRRFHRMLEDGMQRFENQFRSQLDLPRSKGEARRLNLFFKVSSPRKALLKNPA